MALNLAYEKRNISMEGSYELSDKHLDSEVAFWSNKSSVLKQVSGKLRWRLQAPGTHRAQVTVYHPSFKKNLTITGDLTMDEIYLMNMKSLLEYSVDKKKKVSLSSILKCDAKSERSPYSLFVKATHPATRLDLEMSGNLIKENGFFEISKNVSYKRSYLPRQFWNAHFKADKVNKKLEMGRESLRDLAFLKGRYDIIRDGVYLVEGTMTKGKDVQMSGFASADIPGKDASLSVNFTQDASERLLAEAWYRDRSHALLKLIRIYGEESVTDLYATAKLNNSRLLSSALQWRTEIKDELASSAQSWWNYAWTYLLQTVDFWTDYMKNEASEMVSDITFDSAPILQDFLEDVRDMRNFQDDIEYMKLVVNDSYNENEFYMRDAYNMYALLAEEMSFRDKMENLPKIFSELWEAMGETRETIRQTIIWLVDNVKECHAKIIDFFRRFIRGDIHTQISNFISGMTGKYDKVMKDAHVSFVSYVEYVWREGTGFMHRYWTGGLQAMEPTVIEILHHLEHILVEQSSRVFEFFDRSQQEVLQSDYLAKNTNLTRDLERIYRNLTANSLASNIKNYSEMILTILNEKVFVNLPFGFELKEVATEIYGEVSELQRLPFVNVTIQTTRYIFQKVVLMYNNLQITDRVQRILPILARHVADLRRNALDNELRNHPMKTLFVFEPDNGYVVYEQKLPVPWHAFNETPNLLELPEYRRITDIQQLFSPTNVTFWTFYYRYVPYLDPGNWLPPFKGHAMIIGTEYLFTFNNRLYRTFDSYRTRNSYLLAKDFVDNEFSVVLHYDPQLGYHTIVLLVEDLSVSVDLKKDAVNIHSSPIQQLPLEINGTLFVSRENSIATISGKKGFTLECNLKHDVCVVHLSGWYYSKTAGLLGTMDSESQNDFLSSDGKVTADVRRFVESWSLDHDPGRIVTYFEDGRHKQQVITSDLASICDSLFGQKSSEFSICFPVIDNTPFNEMCKSLPEDDGACRAAVAYTRACGLANIPLRPPTICVKCYLTNGTELQEGDFARLSDGSVPRSSEIVFIVEAGKCNADLATKRGFNTLVSFLDEELRENGIRDNRYAVVAFGGSGVFGEPRTIIADDKEFTTSRGAHKLFEHVSTSVTEDPGDGDVFGAISYAAKLKFRAGVSKNFILVPCTDCVPTNMTLDYSVLHQVLTEKGVVLHVLMNSDFNTEKAKLNKVLYGVDADYAFTKNDYKRLTGDMDLRRQTPLTKTLLGYCTPLAIETNGTIFTGKKLGPDGSMPVKKFLSVFAKRVARTAEPNQCQNCECTADANGIDSLHCYPCYLPTPVFNDFGFAGDNFTGSLFQGEETVGDDADMDLDF